MRTVNVGEVIGKSKFNKFFLLVFITLLLVIVFDGFDQAVYGNALPTLMKSTGISASVFGLIGTYTLYGMMAGGILFGMLADRIGRKITLMIGVAFYCIGTGLFGFANTATQFTIFRIIAGMGLAGVAPVGIAIASEYSPVKNRPTIVSVVTAGVPIGSMIAPLLGMYMLPNYGWRPMYLTAFIPLIMIVVLMFLVPESMEKLVRKGENEKVGRILTKADPGFVPNKDNEYITTTSKKKSAPFTSLFKNGMARNTILFWLTFAFMMFINYGISTWLPKIMTTAGYPLGSSLWFMFTFSLGSLPAIGISGWLANKFGYKKTILTYIAISAVLMLLMMLKTNTVILSIQLFLIGGGMYGTVALIYTFIAVNYPNASRGTGVGWASSFGRFGGSFGPMVGGFLIAQKAPFAVNFLLFAIAFILAGIAVSLTKDNSKSSAASAPGKQYADSK